MHPDPEEDPQEPSSGSRPPGPQNDVAARLTGSARGWHTVQMGVLGFIGVCGVLRPADSSAPRWVQVVAAVLAVASFAVACLAVFIVARIAYPTSGADGDERGVAQAGTRLRSGIRLTVVALLLIVLAALSGWWPTNHKDGSAKVAVSDVSGRAWCGAVTDGPDDAVSIRTSEGLVTVSVRTVTQVRPVASCP